MIADHDNNPRRRGGPQRTWRHDPANPQIGTTRTFVTPRPERDGARRKKRGRR